MVIDKLSNAKLYEAISPRFAKAFEFLRKPDLATTADGKYVLQGDEVFALVQSYDTKPKEQGTFEAHRKYIDIQFVVSGDECMGYANLADLKVKKEYDGKDDYLLAEGPADFVRVRPGMFTIFYPQDAHIPCSAIDKPSKVKKVVVKVLV